MNARRLSSGIVITIGVVAMLLGAADPLEGSLVILPGCALITVYTFLSNTDRQLKVYWICIFALIAFGVAALWALSAVGGFGGSSGPSNWWGLLILPYPIGWVMAMVSLLFRLVRNIRHRHAIA